MTCGGHMSGRERAAHPKEKYRPWWLAAWATILLTLVCPGPWRDAFTLSCCFCRVSCISVADAAPWSLWILKKTVDGIEYKGHG